MEVGESQTFDTPAPPQVKRDLGIMLTLWTRHGLKFDLPMPDDFTLQAWAHLLMSTGFFVDWRSSFFVRADEVVSAVAYRSGQPDAAKVLPFQAIDGGKPAA